MKEQWKETLTAAGMDTEEVLNRFLGNEALLSRVLGTFLTDPNFAVLTQALESGKQEEAFRAAHTLKGICGNLSMTGLFYLAGRQTEALRHGDLETARSLMPRTAEAYETMLAAVRACVE